jgi:hypothetical protein
MNSDRESLLKYLESPLLSPRGGEYEILKFNKTHSGIRTAKIKRSGLTNWTLQFCQRFAQNLFNILSDTINKSKL